jgi:hypothetical protein
MVHFEKTFSLLSQSESADIFLLNKRQILNLDFWDEEEKEYVSRSVNSYELHRKACDILWDTHMEKIRA